MGTGHYLPNTGGGVDSDYERFATKAPFSTYIFDNPFQFHPVIDGGCHFIATGLTTMGTVGSGAAHAEIANAEVGGLTVDTSNDSFSFIWYIPLGADMAEDVTLAFLWSNSETAATGTGRVQTKYTFLDNEVTAVAIGATTTGITNHAVQADLGANIPQWTAVNTLAGSTLGPVNADDQILFLNYCTLDTIANMTIYCVRLRYYRKYLE